MKKRMVSYSALAIGFLFSACGWGLNSSDKSTAVDQRSTAILLKGKLCLAKDTITVPLYQGSLRDGRKVWYVLTDTDNRKEADRLGIVFAPQLSRAQGIGTRRAERDADGKLIFESGTVDFKSFRMVVPGESPTFFPPKQFQPGSVGDVDYTPFVTVQTSAGPVVYNSPTLAFDVDASEISFCNGNVNYDLVHDRVVSICPEKKEVTLHLSHGFADGKSLVYLSFDANNPLAATLEASTLAPALDKVKGTSASLKIYAVTNGPTGARNPFRQGLDSALEGEGSPLNILDFLPNAVSGYSPLWDLFLGEWTSDAIAQEKRTRLTSEGQILGTVKAGLMASPGGGKFGSSGILVNCPVVALVTE